MILTVTLNPSIDITVKVKGFFWGEVIRTPKVLSFAGGKGINISRVVKTLGGDTFSTGLLGGVAGEWIEKKLLKDENIPSDFVHIEEETRTNITILDEKSKSETHLVSPGPSIKEKEIELFVKKFKELVRKAHFVIFSGSIPENLPPDIYARLIKMAKNENKGALTVLDTSGEPLKCGFKEKPFMIKPNAEEVSYLVGRKIDSFEEACGALKFFLQKGITFPIISFGKRGVTALYHGKIYKLIPPKTRPLCSVGCGDSFLAGTIYALWKGENIENALQLGTSCGTANALTEGRGIIKKSEIDKFYREIKIKKLKCKLI